MSLYLNIIDMFFPRLCVGCGMTGEYLCDCCGAELRTLQQQECPRCRRLSDEGSFCCENNFYFDQLIVALRYEKQGLLKKLLVHFKYKYAKELAVFLAGFLRKWVKEGWILVPVPLDKRKLKLRGFNQAELLASQLGEVWDCLDRQVNPRRQAGLGRNERLENMEGLFSLRPGFEVNGRRIMLIDDVATTGSTLNECSKVLKDAGAEIICGLVLGRGS